MGTPFGWANAIRRKRHPLHQPRLHRKQWKVSLSPA